MTKKRPRSPASRRVCATSMRCSRAGCRRARSSSSPGRPAPARRSSPSRSAFTTPRPASRVLYFSTLSEPTAKTLRYLSQFSFFDAAKLDRRRSSSSISAASCAPRGSRRPPRLVMEHVKQVKPAIVVIDSFKVFDDLARSKEELRKFGYELAVNLMAWEATRPAARRVRPRATSRPTRSSRSSTASSRVTPARAVRRAAALHPGRQDARHRAQPRRAPVRHHRGRHRGLRAARHHPARQTSRAEEPRCKTGISKLDDLLGEGIPRGSSLLVAGVAGTGKTVLLLEFLYRGAQAGEKGIIFSFEETEERLRATARGLGWDLDGEIERGMIEIVFIPQPDILVESHLLMMRERDRGHGRAARRRRLGLGVPAQGHGSADRPREDLPAREHRAERAGGRLLRDRHPLRRRTRSAASASRRRWSTASSS